MRNTPVVPAGITGTAHAVGRTRRFLAVSWYAKEKKIGNGHKGARITFVDYDRSGASFLRYRHVLLVQNEMNAHDPNLFRLNTKQRQRYNQFGTFVPVPVHAGGIAWYRGFLYVTDTRLGLRVFDPARMYRAVADRERVSCGQTGDGRLFAFDYRYVLPQVGYYPTCGTSPNSTLSVGNIDGVDCLWMGQYVKKSGTPVPPRLFALRLATDGSIDVLVGVTPHAPLDVGARGAFNMQGAHRENGRTWLSVTARKCYARSTARLITEEALTAGGQRWRWPHGAEGLYVDHRAVPPALWCLTEHHPGAKKACKDLTPVRVVFAADFQTYAPAARLDRDLSRRRAVDSLVFVGPAFGGTVPPVAPGQTAAAQCLAEIVHEVAAAPLDGDDTFG